MSFQAVTSIGTGAPGTFITTGILTPTAVNQCAVVALSAGVGFTPDPPAGWNIAQPQIYFLQSPTLIPVQTSVEITGYLDLLNSNWNTVLGLFETSGPIALLSGGGGSTLVVPGTQTIPWGGPVVLGTTIFVYVANFSEVNVGDNGFDPLPNVSDDAANIYTLIGKASIVNGTTYVTYLFAAFNVPAAASLTVSIVCAGIRGPANGNVFGLSNIINPTPPVGHCFGGTELW